MANKVPPKVPPKRAKMSIRDIINELVERSNANMRRLRVLEQNSEVMGNRIRAAEGASTETKTELSKSIGELDKRILEESERVIKMEAVLKDVVARLKKVVTTGKIKELEQLLEIYNPIKSQFVTKEEVERLIEERTASK